MENRYFVLSPYIYLLLTRSDLNEQWMKFKTVTWSGESSGNFPRIIAFRQGLCVTRLWSTFLKVGGKMTKFGPFFLRNENNKQIKKNNTRQSKQGLGMEIRDQRVCIFFLKWYFFLFQILQKLGSSRFEYLIEFVN